MKSMDKKNILGSLAMDLKRAALGFYRGSDIMASRFLDEAIKRKNEYKSDDLKPYIKKILTNLEVLKKETKNKSAETALMYSTLIQNYIRSNP